ncbi:general secretion pathway protein N [Pseudomonas duriflava]|uniref:General secretion pathway protein N n=1 Tax=Pseudomonas duriflava TaxID=459528 RepID=A0A562QKU9_9PSED|nr:general secretion pathway protein GspN [Pseudomonas duriflava]TWI56676.1 general secretion pathway protein N [Pseudomonas duriflava]
MNQADHRRLTPWLLIVAVLLAALALALAVGINRQVKWLPPQEAPRQAASADAQALPVPPPLDAYANTWKQPLFSPDRQPDQQMAQASEPQQLQGFSLTGVIVTNTLQVALLKDSSGKDFSLVRGKQLPNGWTLERVEATQVLFTAGDRQQILPLSREKAPLGTSAAPTAASGNTARAAPRE